MSVLDAGRIGIASQAIGIARAAYEATLAYVKERRSDAEGAVILDEALGALRERGLIK